MLKLQRGKACVLLRRCRLLSLNIACIRRMFLHLTVSCLSKKKQKKVPHADGDWLVLLSSSVFASSMQTFVQWSCIFVHSNFFRSWLCSQKVHFVVLLEDKRQKTKHFHRMTLNENCGIWQNKTILFVLIPTNLVDWFNFPPH